MKRPSIELWKYN